MTSVVTDDINSEISSMKKFINDNNIVGTCAGVCVGLAAKDSINSLVQDVIGPSIVLGLQSLNIGWLTTYLPIDTSSQLNIFNFFKNLFSFFLVIIVSMTFVYFAFIYLLGINNKDKNSSTSTTPSTSATSSTSAATSATLSAALPSTSSNTSQISNVESSLNKTFSDLFTTMGSKYSVTDNFENYLSYSNH